MMFTASPGYTLIGSDYSQQEPRLLAHYSKDNNMIKAYEEGKDLYAVIASKIYKNNYEDNLEFLPDGSKYVEGGERRTSVKSVLLGIMYGLGTKSLAEKLKVSFAEASDIINSFYKEFPKVKNWMDTTISSAHLVLLTSRTARVRIIL